MSANTRGFRPIRLLGIAFTAVAAMLGVSVFEPQLLAFPYRTQVGEIVIYSVEAPGPELAGIVTAAQARIAKSGIAAPLGRRSIFLTDGGWRWRLLSLPSSHGAFAITRPLSSAIVLNMSSIRSDAVRNGAGVGGDRTLSGTIAHESTHLLIYRRYGVLAAIGFPRWAVEGYCDHVAGESSLSADEAAALRRAGAAPPALVYYDARVRVDKALSGGTTVDALMRGD